MMLILAFFTGSVFQIIFSKGKNPPSLSIFYGKIVPVHFTLRLSCLLFTGQEGSKTALSPRVD